MKAALIAASAVGTVSVGGVTWAATGQSDFGLTGGASKAPAAVQKVQDAAPAAPPTCLPKSKLPKLPATPKASNLPKAPDASKPNLPLPKDVPTLPKDVPGTPKDVPGLPKDVPGTPKDLPGAPATLPAAPKDLPKNLPATPGVPGAPQKVPGAPALPDCGPDAGRLPGAKPSTLPTALPKPGAPKLPAVPALRCDSLPPAVPVGGSVEKTLILPKGLAFTTAHSAVKEVNGRRFCTITQKWAGKAGQWLTVERLKVPAGVTEKDLRKTLKLPAAGGRQITVNGHAAWQSPSGEGVLVYDQNGYSLLVNGSPVMAGGLKDLTGALQAR
ncbi:hypothetical protein [Spirillospora sp. NPDC047279]|uniref:hypothetical protein n=1 Tax=Spirillospora sp. NPDC047279 TaxID=3155478 RepID=UPI0033C30C55